MSDQRLYISSGSIGQVEFDNGWFQTENAEFYLHKAIPLFHLISNLMSLVERYHRNLARIGRYENYPQTANEFIKTATNLAKSYAKVKKLSDDMICAFNDALIDDCMQVYNLYLNKKRLNKYLHILVNVEIMDIFPKIDKNLLKFKREIIILYSIVKKLSRRKMKELKLQQIFMSDIKKQFKKIIRTNGVYFIN